MSKDKQNENDGYIYANTKCIKCDSNNVYYNINDEKDYYICHDCGAEFNDNKRLGKSFSNAFQLSLTGKALKVAIFLIVFLAVIGFFVPRYIRQKIAEDNVEKMSCVGLSTMSFSQIKKDANNNLEKARKKYVDNSYTFTAVIERIDGREIVTPIEKGDYSGSYITVNKTELERLSKYKRGDKITICGTVKEISLYHKVYVKNATIIK